MAMTITNDPLVTLDAAEDLSGREGYAGVITGGEIALADGGEDTTVTVVGVISSVQGNFADGNMSASLQVSGVAYAVLGGAVTAGDLVTWAATGGDANWIEAATGGTKYAKGYALQTGAITELIQVALIGTTVSTVA